MSKYFALLTRLGADRLANAAALGTKIEITQMAVGDGGGSLPTPDTNQQKLVNEKRRAAINVLSVDPKNTNQIIAEQVIPESEGGWWIREIGLFDKDGVLIAVGNCAETYKPQLQEGSGRTQTIRMVLIVSHTNAVTLKIDPSVVLATREYADSAITQAIRAHEQSRRHPDATLSEKGFVILNSAVDSQSETQAATPKAVKTAYALASAANNNANGRVPTWRKVNGKALSADITLGAGDVGAYTQKETDARIHSVKELANIATQQAANANNNANTRLEKAKNGADIQNKSAFIHHLGLTKTMELAREALPKNSTERFTSGPHTIQSITDDYVTLRLKKPDGRYTFFESTPHDSKAICAIGYREPDQTNINVVYLPKKSGMVAMADEVYSKSAVYTKDEVYPKTAVYTKNEVYPKTVVYTKADVYTKSESDARFSRQKNVGLLEPVGWWRDSDTGYTRQWGYLGREGDSVGTTVVTFPTQFFRECTSVTVAHIRVSGQVMLSVGGVTKSGFTVIPSEKCNGVFWSAEGY